MLIKNLNMLVPSSYRAMGKILARKEIFLQGIFASSIFVNMVRCFYTTSLHPYISPLYSSLLKAFGRKLLVLRIEFKDSFAQFLPTKSAFLNRKFIHVYFFTTNLINVLGLTPDKTEKTGPQLKINTQVPARSNS